MLELHSVNFNDGSGYEIECIYVIVCLFVKLY